MNKLQNHPITTDLIHWFSLKARDLPWRETTNPFHVWLSEIILQQTRVDQGTSYFYKFKEAFPSIEDLANADIDHVLKLWQGLGYYSRARNLHKAARQVVTEFKGEFPNNYEDLLKLKGVGPYTAAAISSICFNEVRPVIDGNVYRVISRLYGINTPIDTAQGHHEIAHCCDELIDTSNPGNFNQALMEFGALHCTPKNPGCSECIFKSQCVALRKGQVSELPTKKGKVKVKDRYLHFHLSMVEGKLRLQKRTEGIWNGLYEFPNTECSKEEFLTSNTSDTISEYSTKFKHLLSHQRIHAKFSFSEEDFSDHSTIDVEYENLHLYPISKLTENFLNEAEGWILEKISTTS